MAYMDALTYQNKKEKYSQNRKPDIVLKTVKRFNIKRTTIINLI